MPEELKEGVSARFVHCQPTDDPEVVEQKHRASCLLKVMPKCHTCPNSKFALFFHPPEKKFEQCLCPRWKSAGARHSGEKPEEYVITELATCRETPFEFCRSCPSSEELQKMDIDKGKDGWYSRWTRFRKELFDGAE